MDNGESQHNNNYMSIFAYIYSKCIYMYIYIYNIQMSSQEDSVCPITNALSRNLPRPPSARLEQLISTRAIIQWTAIYLSWKLQSFLIISASRSGLSFHVDLGRLTLLFWCIICSSPRSFLEMALLSSPFLSGTSADIV